MPLPILQPHGQPTRQDLIRLFHQTESRWTQHLAEETLLDVGTGFSNPQLPDVYDANNIRDVALPDEMSVEAAVAQVDAHYAAQGTPCAYWTFNPSAPADRTRPLADHLLALNYSAHTNDIMVLARDLASQAPSPSDLRIIPARASFRHVRQLFEEETRRRGRPIQIVDAAMLHLDDSHWDALLALKDGVPVAYVGVLSVGEIGKIEHMLVAEPYRGQGIGTTMMGRAIEICARSLFRHVMLAVRPTNAVAIALYRKLGFARLSEVTGYFAPGTSL
jgi:GNAT superfamily N-acetyltransferase